MSNLRRYDPFSIDQMSDLIQGLFGPTRAVGVEGADLAGIKIDVSEKDDAYLVDAELPGVDKKDIDVQIDGRLVSINAKVERNNEEKDGERVIRRERYSGSFSRSFQLATDVDQAKSQAEYKDGVLTLTLPKKATAESKRISVS